MWLNPLKLIVSIHAPAGGATAPVLTLPMVVLFQSTRLREARRSLPLLVTDVSGFNPRACGRRDVFH